MISRRLGAIAQNEKNRVRDLYDRMAALNETAQTLDNDFTTEEQRQLLKSKISEKMQSTRLEYAELWKGLAEQYGWAKEENENWMIDFQTNEVYAAKLNS